MVISKYNTSNQHLKEPASVFFEKCYKFINERTAVYLHVSSNTYFSHV